MSKNPTFDDVLSHVFLTLDTVYQLHAPERPDDEKDAGNCISCGVEFPCTTEEAILEGLAQISLIMEEAKKTSSSDSPAESEQPSS